MNPRKTEAERLNGSLTVNWGIRVGKVGVFYLLSQASHSLRGPFTFNRLSGAAMIVFLIVWAASSRRKIREGLVSAFRSSVIPLLKLPNHFI